MDDHKQADVIIIGAGMVGACVALALADGGLSVQCYDAGRAQHKLAKDEAYQLRVSAISEASRQWLEQLGVWSSIQSQRAYAYRQMHVWQEAEHALLFDADDIGVLNLGHIVENRAIVAALQDKMAEHALINVHYEHKVEAIEQANPDATDAVSATFTNQSTCSAALLIAADGGLSKTRELAGIGVDESDYAQAGLVATLKTAEPLQATAWQKFLYSGPLAFLPLSDYHCSIVWTLPADQVAYYEKIDKAQLADVLSEHMERRFGELEIDSEVVSFPLLGRHAKQYSQGAVVLVGDAAHSIHPMAGQGVNLGFKDALALTELLLKRDRQERLNAPALLARYEYQRRLDNQMTLSALESLGQWFAYDNAQLNPIKQKALSVFNKSPLKNIAMRKAIGL